MNDTSVHKLQNNAHKTRVTERYFTLYAMPVYPNADLALEIDAR